LETETLNQQEFSTPTKRAFATI